MNNEPTGDDYEMPPEPHEMALSASPPRVPDVAAGAMTPAQARVEAVGNTLHAAYAKASNLQLTTEETKALTADFPDDAFLPGAAGKEHLLYLSHPHLRDRMNEVLGIGQWTIVRTRPHWAEPFSTQKGKPGTRIYAECALLIRGCFCAENIGDMDYYPNDATNYGDAAKGAVTAAFRRCASDIGIGLQPFKKDFCEAWWARKRAGSRPPVPPASPPKPKTAPSPPQTAKTQPAASQTPPAPSWTKRTPNEQKEHIARLEAWLAQCKTELLKRLEPVKAGADEYAAKAGVVLPGETLADATVSALFRSVDWNLTVDQNKLNVKKDFDALTKGVQAFMDGDRLPDEDNIPMGDVPDSVPPVFANDEWWWDLIIPVPRKGMKRDEYLKRPDTIRSLYDQRHGTDEDAQLARERLFGFTNHYEPKGWVNKQGKQMPASDSDRKFRDALDLFAQFMEDAGEKL